MKERFIEIKNLISKKTDLVFRTVLEMPPSYDEVAANFRHDKGCSKTKTLVNNEFEEYINFSYHGGWGIGSNYVTVKLRFLECPECHASQRYSG